MMSKKWRRFNKSWFDKYANWLEYSIKEDAVYCLCCYLFKSEDSTRGGGDAFTSKGFSAWNKRHRCDTHVGLTNSLHNQCYQKCVDLMFYKQTIQTNGDKQSEQAKSEYWTSLNASVEISRQLLTLGLPFHGHDESELSYGKGNFLHFLKWYSEINEDVRSVLKNALGKDQMTSPSIQKEIAKACSNEIVHRILEELGDGYFAILVDVSCEEQLTLVLRYVDKMGFVMERLIGLIHVSDTCSLSLKDAIFSLLSQYSLSPSHIKGQCYDGASYMQGHIHGLKSLILQDSPSAHYIHCFAHQLHPTLVTVLNDLDDIEWFLDCVRSMMNVVGASYKCRDDLRDKLAKKVQELIWMDELQTERGLNQEFERPKDTCSGSHYRTFTYIIVMFDSIIDVFDAIASDGKTSYHRVKAQVLLDNIQSFKFAFILHLLNMVLGMTKPLSLSLESRDETIINVILLVDGAKECLQETRDNEWDSHLEKVCAFCVKHDIVIPNMDDIHIARGKSRHRVFKKTIEHNYRVDTFYAVIDMILLELNNRFSKTATDLLLGVASLNPTDSFSNFDKKRLLRMAQLYPDDFDELSIEILSCELDTFIANVPDDERFSNLIGLIDLSRKLVQTKKHLIFPYLHLLLKLTLLLSVSIPTISRVPSAIKYIKNHLCNRISNEFLNDTAIAFFEDDVFNQVTNDDIMLRFRNGLTLLEGQQN